MRVSSHDAICARIERDPAGAAVDEPAGVQADDLADGDARRRQHQPARAQRLDLLRDLRSVRQR